MGRIEVFGPFINLLAALRPLALLHIGGPLCGPIPIFGKHPVFGEFILNLVGIITSLHYQFFQMT